MIWTIILVIILFVLLIFPHELGHFLCAKAFGVQVNEFAFGMGPVVRKKQRGETLYSWRAIPIGGFCAMEGEDNEPSKDNPRAFNNKKWWKKILILLSGAAMNILIAIIMLSIATCVAGIPTNTISHVANGSPAMEAGIQPGDKIISIDGEETDDLQEIMAELQQSSELTVGIERNGKLQYKTVIPEYDKNTYNRGRYVIGVNAKLSHNPVKSLLHGTKTTVKLTGAIGKALKNLFMSADGLKDVSGPVGMISAVHQSVSYGAVYFLYLVALISINLAIFNLLPLPALDGGRIIFVFIRKITGSAISDKVEARVHAIGIIFLLGLLVFATWHDILRLFQ